MTDHHTDARIRRMLARRVLRHAAREPLAMLADFDRQIAAKLRADADALDGKAAREVRFIAGSSEVVNMRRQSRAEYVAESRRQA